MTLKKIFLILSTLEQVSNCLLYKHLTFNIIAQRFPQSFVDSYMKIVYGASTKDAKLVYEGSVEVGLLTGEENKEFLEAHVNSILIIGEPFASQTPFDFGNQTMSARIYEKMPIVLGQRLTPTPSMVYSLHRMLSGGYLICMKLGAVVHVSKLFEEVRTRYLIKRGL